jgi:hypothetical protein
MNTDHEHVPYAIGEPSGFVSEVARSPFTSPNPAAHGCITFKEGCRICGAERKVNANQGHREYSPWGPDRATRERWDREQEERKLDALRERGRRMMRSMGIGVLQVTEEQVLILHDARQEWHARASLLAAAHQDGGDTYLAAFYLALEEAIQSVESVHQRR